MLVSSRKIVQHFLTFANAVWIITRHFVSNHIFGVSEAQAITVHFAVDFLWAKVDVVPWVDHAGAL